VPQQIELPFVGRDAELAILQQLQDGPKLILIEGEPGIGKSCLAEQFIRISGALGFVGAARELEHTLPYHPVIDALRTLLAHADWPVFSRNLDLAPIWRAEIARLLPELLPNGPPPALADETRLWEALSQLLQSLARARQVVLFFDDIQWADTTTLGLLAYLARRSSNAPLTLVAAARPTAPRSGLATLIQTLTREGRIVRMPLARLGSEEIRTLANTISPSYPQPLAEWLERGAEGNPYITVELIRYARDQRLLAANGTLFPELLSTSPIVPQTVESLIQSRLERLSSPARLMLDIAVAAGREFVFEIIAHASALPESAVLDGLDELRAGRLIEPLPDGRWRFDHSLTMEVAYREVGEPRHRRLHRRVAEALEVVHADQIDSVAGVLAWHLAEAGAEQRAAIFALRAARRASGLAAWQEAITFYRMALVGRPTSERLPITIELGEALSHIGDPATIETYHQAIGLAQALGEHAALDAARLALGRALIQQARYAEVIALVRQIREQGHPGSAVRAELVWGIALSVEGADLAAASQHLLIAEQLSDTQADPATHSNIVFELGSVCAQQGDLSAAIAYYREALADAERDPSAVNQRILAHNNLAYHLHLLGDQQAEEQANAGLQLAQEAGILSLQPFLRSTLGEIALARNDLDHAEHEFSEGLALAERIHMPERVAGLTANLGLVAQRRGQETLAVHRLSAAQAQADGLGLPHMAAQIRIWLTPLLPPDEARATLAAARAISESGGRKRLLAEIARIETTLVR
jgi:predicted ATPase